MDSTKKHTDEQRILSFCYGYGGLEKGISRIIPIKPVAYVEIEAFQNFNLVSAMESGMVDKAPIWTNLKTFDAKPFHNRVHGIIGGYPCQGESLAGKRKLWNDERFLWPYIERSIKSANPVFCFFENVGGHLTGSFPYVLESLRDLGYSVESGLFTAAEVGAPHKRERLFILAVLADTTGDRWIRKWKEFENKNREKRSKEIGELERGSKGLCEILSNPRNERRHRDIQSSRHEKTFAWPSLFCKNVSYTTSKRNGESRKEYQTRKFIENGNQWPSGPGQEQFRFESQRTVEPGMGCTVNGYNFRTELLRQYGNGVVSETATKAFSMLLDKHLTNIK